MTKSKLSKSSKSKTIRASGGKKLGSVDKTSKGVDESAKLSEPKTMDELLARYGGGSSGLSRGDVVHGEVIELMPGRVVVDIGGKSEGIVAEKAYQEAEFYIKTLKVGDKIEASVIVSETPDGYTILSLRKSARDAIWEKLERVEESLKPIVVCAKSVNPSGVIVDVYGLNGFIPKSQLGKEALKNTQSLLEERFEAVVIDTDRESRKIVLSEKEVSEKEQLARIRKAIKNVGIGDIYEGEVASIYDFGCFVKITIEEGGVNKKKTKKKNVNVEGLVHISELSWEKVNNPADLVTVGDRVEVKIIGKNEGRLALSVKQAKGDPWEDIKKTYKKDQKIKGKVVRVSDFGLFVALEPGVEGLVHVTKIPPGKTFEKGDEVNVYVEEVDKENHKLALGLVLTEKPVGYK